jgi:hypothetical protein
MTDRTADSFEEDASCEAASSKKSNSPTVLHVTIPQNTAGSLKETASCEAVSFREPYIILTDQTSPKPTPG